MGCDIHLYVEKKNPVSGKWEPDGKFVDKHGEGYADIPYEERIYSDRNYDLFAILADVRNGRGFAGCKTGEGFVPISSPRGLPSDVSPQVKSVSVDWGVDGHSHSYFTVEELDKYDWSQETVGQGYITPDVYDGWFDRDEPAYPHCGDVGGPNVIKYAEAEWLSAGKPRREGVYILVQWNMMYSVAAGSFFTKALPKLRKMGHPDEVRIVFWFDN